MKKWLMRRLRVDRERGVYRGYHGTHSWYSTKVDFFPREYFSVLTVAIKLFLPVL